MRVRASKSGGVFILLCVDFLTIAEEPLEFVRPLENIEVKELPATVKLECELTIAFSQVEWMKNGRPLKLTNRHQVMAEGKVHRLIIKDICAEDDAQYSVVAKNKSSTADLTIEGE